MQFHFGKVISCFLILWLLHVVLTVYATHNTSPFLITILICLFPVFIFEFIVLSVLYLAYGQHYMYSLFSYFLVDHPVYGTCLRKNCSSKNVEHFIFDKFAFQAGTRRNLTLNDNMNERLIFNVNSLGYRGREFSSREKSGKLRIFCSGGSTTAGDHNNDDQTWPAQLQMCFKERGFDVEVINAGVQGWYSYKELLRFKEEIRGYNTDIVLLHEGWNEEFEYSSLSLGKKWTAESVRNVREENNLYCPPSKILSSTRVVSLYMTVQWYFKTHVFVPNMRFTNPERWRVLKSKDYIVAWHENMVEFASLCHEKNICLYTIDYPALTNLEDSFSDRNLYLENSRLTPLFADYQAVSKKRISRTLSESAKIIPCLNADGEFTKYCGKERLDLFYDEMHMTPQGNWRLANVICEKLLQDSFFVDRYRFGTKDARRSNVNVDFDLIEQVRDALLRNSPFLDRFIDSRIAELNQLEKEGGGDLSEMPTDRYTTF